MWRESAKKEEEGAGAVFHQDNRTCSMGAFSVGLQGNGIETLWPYGKACIYSEDHRLVLHSEAKRLVHRCSLGVRKTVSYRN